MTSRRLRVEIAALDLLGELDLLFAAEQRVPANLLQEQRHRVRSPLREVVIDVSGQLRLHPPAVVADVEPALLEHVLKLLRVVLGELPVLRQIAELGQVDAPDRARVRTRRQLVGEFLECLRWG